MDTTVDTEDFAVDTTVVDIFAVEDIVEDIVAEDIVAVGIIVVEDITDKSAVFKLTKALACEGFFWYLIGK